MPISIDGKVFHNHDEVVKHLRKTRPKIGDPDSYVATVERAQKKAQQLEATIEDDVSKRRIKDTYKSGVPYGYENRLRKEIRDDEIMKSITEGSIKGKTKILLDKPKQKDWERIISAKEKLATLEEKRKRLDIEREYFNKSIKRPALGMSTDDKLYEMEHLKKFVSGGVKIRPPNNPKKFSEFIENRLAQLKLKIKEEKITKKHNHQIIFRTANKNPLFKTASLVSNDGVFAKYWLLNAKQTNGNGWGVSPHTIKQHIARYKGRPFVITSNKWIPDSEYGEGFEHPYVPTNDVRVALRYQEKFRVGNIDDIFEDKNGDWFASIRLLPKFANYRLPPFCSPAIFQLDETEPDDNISIWEPLHLAGLMEDPAYGARVALLKGTCIGTSQACSIQFKGAKISYKAKAEKLKAKLALQRKSYRIKDKIIKMGLRNFDEDEKNRGGLDESQVEIIKSTPSEINKERLLKYIMDRHKPGTQYSDEYLEGVRKVMRSKSGLIGDNEKEKLTVQKNKITKMGSKRDEIRKYHEEEMRQEPEYKEQMRIRNEEMEPFIKLQDKIEARKKQKGLSAQITCPDELKNKIAALRSETNQGVNRISEYERITGKQRPKKPTQKYRLRIIQAKIKISKLKQRFIKESQQKEAIDMRGIDIVNRFKQKVPSIPKNTGFTFLHHEGELVDATEKSGVSAHRLLRKFGIGEGESLAFISRTKGLTKPDELPDIMEKVRAEKRSPHIGGFAGESGFELDVTFPLKSKNDEDIIKALNEPAINNPAAVQESALVIRPDKTVEFLKNPHFKKQ